jgi:hypothetical protein
MKRMLRRLNDPQALAEKAPNVQLDVTQAGPARWADALEQGFPTAGISASSQMRCGRHVVHVSGREWQKPAMLDQSPVAILRQGLWCLKGVSVSACQVSSSLAH